MHFKKFFGKYFLVFGKEEGKHKPQPRSRRPTTASSIAIQDRDRRCDRDLAFFTRSQLQDRDRWRDLAKRRRQSRSGAISRRRDRDLREIASTAISIRCDLAKARSRSRFGAIAISIQSRDCDQRRDLVTARSQSTATGMFASEIVIDAD